VARNSETLGAFATLDLRYSRFVGIAGQRQAEIFAEFKNLLNRQNVRAVNSVVSTDTQGNPLAPIPEKLSLTQAADAFTITQTYEPRQFQLGFRLHF
jgi:hypothetical protein